MRHTKDHKLSYLIEDDIDYVLDRVKWQVAAWGIQGEVCVNKETVQSMPHSSGTSPTQNQDETAQQNRKRPRTDVGDCK